MLVICALFSCKKLVLKGCIKTSQYLLSNTLTLTRTHTHTQVSCIVVRERTSVEYRAEETGSAPQAHYSYSFFTPPPPHAKTHTHTYIWTCICSYTHVINPAKWNSTHLRRDLSAQNTNSIRGASTRSLSAGKMDHLWALQATSRQHCFGLVSMAVVNCILGLCSAVAGVPRFKKLFLFLLFCKHLCLDVRRAFWYKTPVCFFIILTSLCTN